MSLRRRRDWGHTSDLGIEPIKLLLRIEAFRFILLPSSVKLRLHLSLLAEARTLKCRHISRAESLPLLRHAGDLRQRRLLSSQISLL